MFPIDRFAEIQQHPQDFKLLERVPLTRDDVLARLPVVLCEATPNERVSSMIFLDTETTGMNPGRDKIIELGMVRCTVSLDRNIILSVDSIYDAYEDPKMPIPPEITKLTTITDDMVRGQSFNMDDVMKFFADRPLVVAHNAKFDRPFFDRRFQNLNKMAWACSQNEVDWGVLGFNGVKLEFLLQSNGYFYNAHRASYDCLALCFLMHVQPKALEMLITNSLLMTYRIDAVKAPFDIKNTLKENGYRWDADNKLWYIQVNGAEDAVAQVEFLGRLYPNAFDNVRVISYTAQDRYR